jgi:hypothetical protein
VPCIGQNILTEIIYNCPGLLDRVNLNLSKCDLYFVTVKAQKCQKPDLVVLPKLKPDKFIIRYQWLELLVHLARERYAYTKTGYKIELDLYVIKMIENNLKDLMNNPKFDSQSFRDSMLWNEYCDSAIKANIKVLKDVFKAYSGKLSVAGSRCKHMSAPEFVELIDKLDILADKKDNDENNKPGAKNEPKDSHTPSVAGSAPITPMGSPGKKGDLTMPAQSQPVEFFSRDQITFVNEIPGAKDVSINFSL